MSFLEVLIDESIILFANSGLPLLGHNILIIFSFSELFISLKYAYKYLFEDPQQIELRKQKSKKQFEDPVNRYKAGNGKRGKSWFYDPITNHSILCFPNEKPDNYIKGRIVKK